MNQANRPANVVIVGAGVAGTYAALSAIQAGARSVYLLSASPLAQTASWWAQGGVAAAIAKNDSPLLHLQDTLKAGRSLVRESAAQVLCEEAPWCLADLQRLGVTFDVDENGLPILGLEGGHSIRRVAHAEGSATGMHILRQLAALVSQEPKIVVADDTAVTSLVVTSDGRCVGADTADGRKWRGSSVILATGGAAALWSRTTNPAGSSGSGLMLAASVDATLADLEFIQFHPTAVINIPGLDGFLISEAVRGEGATLHDRNGERFIDELKPRDVVARAIHAKLIETDSSAVYLDMRNIPESRFPHIVKSLRNAGCDPLHNLVPVAPAAHYTIGGIVTDLHGMTSIESLYAVGECACTGLHGANRLASNSLSECLVFGRRAGISAVSEPIPSDWLSVNHTNVITREPTQAVKDALWKSAGLERNSVGLTELLSEENLLVRLIAKSALAREETRGTHMRSDFPKTDSSLDSHHTLIRPSEESIGFEEWH